MNLGLGLACGSFRKPLKCGVLAEVSASHSSVGRLRKFPQAHSSVRGVCGSFRKLLASVRGVCGSFRKLTQVCGAFAEVSASFSQVCGAFAEVSASSLKCAAHLRKFPQAHSSVRRICGSFRKHVRFSRFGIFWCQLVPACVKFSKIASRKVVIGR